MLWDFAEETTHLSDETLRLSRRALAKAVGALAAFRLFRPAASAGQLQAAPPTLPLTVRVRQMGAYGDGRHDDTDSFVKSINLGGTAGTKELVLDPGRYSVNGGMLLLANPHSLLLRGSGTGMCTAIALRDDGGPLLQLGDGLAEPFSITVRDFTIDVAEKRVAVAVLLHRMNLAYFDNVEVRGFDDSVAVSGSGGMLQELYFHRLSVSGQSSERGTCIDFAPTGSIDFVSCNLENARHALRIRGRRMCVVTFTGGHIERTLRAIDAEDCQLELIGSSVPQGDVLLGAGVHASRLSLGDRDSSIANGGLSDLGFGNAVVAIAALKPHGAQTMVSLRTDGEEWLRVENLVDDPLFRTGVSEWHTLGARASHNALSFPTGHGGGSLVVTASTESGYAERTFSADPSTEYLLTIGFAIDDTNASSARVQVLDERGVSLYDSGIISFPTPTHGGTLFRMHRKRIVVGPGDEKTLTIRVYSERAGVSTVCPLLLVARSLLRLATDVHDGEKLGDGGSLRVERDLRAGRIRVTTAGGHRGPYRVYFRAVATERSTFIGVGGDSNTPDAAVNFELDRGEREYCLHVPSFPNNGELVFYSYERVGTVSVSDLTMHAVYPPNQLPPAVLTRHAKAPSVGAGSRVYVAKNSIPTPIHDFSHGVEGQEITLMLDGRTTLQASPTLRLRGGLNVAGQAIVKLVYVESAWRELSRAEL